MVNENSIREGMAHELRYLVLVREPDNTIVVPGNGWHPYDTPYAAYSALLREFERLVKQVHGTDHVIAYEEDGSADYLAFDKPDHTYEINPNRCETLNGYTEIFWVDSDEGGYYGYIIKIIVEPDMSEEDRIYARRRVVLLCEEAARQFWNYLGINLDAGIETKEGAENERIGRSFMETYGFTVNEAVNSASEYCLLDRIVSWYLKLQDNDIAANSTWSKAILRTLSSIK